MPELVDNIDVRANELTVSLTAAETFTIPAVDLSGTGYTLPTVANTNIAAEVSKLTNANLTTGIVGGTGTFDVLMKSFSTHLKEEFDKGRITGADYTRAYIAMTEAAMSGAVQFLLGRDQAFWVAQRAQIDAYTAKVQLETAKVQYATVRGEAINQKINYALTKIKLSNESIAFSTAKYQLSNILPAELTKLNAEKDNVVAQTAVNTGQASLVGSQKLLVDTQKSTETNKAAQILVETTNLGKQGAILDYQASFTLPAEKARIEAETARITADKNVSTYQVTDILPTQKAQLLQETVNLATDKSIKDYTLSSMMPAELAKLNEETANLVTEGDIQYYNLATMLPAQKLLVDAQKAETTQKTTNLATENSVQSYNLTNILPKQLALIGEQVEVQRAQTLNNRTDGTTITGSIGKQKDLYTQQITAYQRDAEVKAAKLFTDAWITQKTIDEGLLAPTGFQNTSVDTVLTKIKQNHGLT